MAGQSDIGSGAAEAHKTDVQFMQVVLFRECSRIIAQNDENHLQETSAPSLSTTLSSDISAAPSSAGIRCVALDSPPSSASISSASPTGRCYVEAASFANTPQSLRIGLEAILRLVPPLPTLPRRANRRAVHNRVRLRGRNGRPQAQLGHDDRAAAVGADLEREGYRTGTSSYCRWRIQPQSPLFWVRLSTGWGTTRRLRPRLMYSAGRSLPVVFIV